MAAPKRTLAFAAVHVIRGFKEPRNRVTRSRIYCSLQHRGLSLSTSSIHLDLSAKFITRTVPKVSGCLQCKSLCTNAVQYEDNDTAELAPDDGEAPTIQEKPKGYLAWKPVDDVYMRFHYPPQPHTFYEAMEILRKQDKWMFCRRAQLYADRTVTISVNLDMKLKKKKKVDPFQNMLILPHAFKPDNKILCFAMGPDVQAALDAGAHIVAGEELVPDVLSRKLWDFDFCIATPDMMPELVPLKRLLRKRFPTSKRGSVGLDLATMIHRYRKGQEYKCQVMAGHVNVSVGKLSLTNEQIEENMQCIITDICKHKPLEYGTFITKLTVNAFLLDGVKIDFEKYLPAPTDELGMLTSEPDQSMFAV